VGLVREHVMSQFDGRRFHPSSVFSAEQRSKRCDGVAA
jgi:hypothetical protein